MRKTLEYTFLVLGIVGFLPTVMTAGIWPFLTLLLALDPTAPWRAFWATWSALSFLSMAAFAIAETFDRGQP